MKLRKQVPRRRGDEELTPLINVVFLLLIFVVLAGEVVETAPFAVTPPDAEAAEVVPVEMTSVYLSSAGEIFLAGKMYPPGDITGAVAALPADTPPEMTIEADRGVDASSAVALVRALQKAGVRQIRLITSATGG